MNAPKIATSAHATGSMGAGGGANTSRVARWDGFSWQALGTGLTPATNSAFPVSAMAKYGSTLVIGGTFTEVGEVTADNVAVWDGSSWSARGTGTGAPAVFMVFEILAYDGRVLAVS
jgi:hypothetical protein